MKNYTSKSQKIDLYSKKYNRPKEEIDRILSSHEDLLTFEELKIKYDNPNIGVLPDWLTEKELDLMIWKTIHENWNELFMNHTTKEDLYMECQEYIRKKIALYDNHNHLKASLTLRMRTLMNEYTRKGKYFLGSLDETYNNQDGQTSYKFEPYSLNENVEVYKESEIISKIKSVKDKSLQDVLIITGYLICNIDELRGEYLNILRSCSSDIRDSIILLEEIVLENDYIDRCKLENKPINSKKVQLTVIDIVKALKLNIFKDTNNNTTIRHKILSYMRQFNVYEIFSN